MRLKEYDLKPKVLWPPEKSNETWNDLEVKGLEEWGRL
jgi:hypothetical protein